MQVLLTFYDIYMIGGLDMSIMPMNQGSKMDATSTDKFRKEKNASKNDLSKAINGGIAGAINMADIACVPGDQSYELASSGYPDSDPTTAIARMLDKMIKGGTQHSVDVFMHDKSAETGVKNTPIPQGGGAGTSNEPIPSIDVKGI
jgi:hypothetical protein